MDPQVSSSFIPKKNLESAVTRPSGRSTGLLLLLAILIFVASLVAAGGVFAYKGLLKQSIASKSNSLSLNQKAYDPGVIQELTRVDTRINEANTLLDKHIAPSAIFGFLSQQTLEKVQFVNFNYEGGTGIDGSSKISLNGLADSFSTVALQSDQFGASKILKDVVFSGVTVDATTGKVSFSVSASIVPSLTLYTNVLSASPVEVLNGEEGTTPTDTPATPTQ